MNTKVHIIHFNDVHGFAAPGENAIGYPKIAGFIENFRKEHPDTLVLDAGDAFAGSALTALDKGEGILAILNTMGLDAMCAGNADFTLGAELLLHRAEQATFPLLSAAMCYEDGRDFLPGTTIVTLPSGVRAGIVGLTTPRAGAAGLCHVDMVQTARQMVKKLQGQVEILIGLTHLGDSPQERDTSVRLAREVEGFDVIIDGHSHSLLPHGRLENGTLIVQAGEYSTHLGLVELDLTQKIATARLLDKEAFATIKDKAETAAVLAATLGANQAILEEVVGSTAVVVDGTRNTIRTRETTAGNVVTDAARALGNTDIALLIAGTIGGYLQPGPINREDVLTLIRVNTPLVVLEASGEDIALFLQAASRTWPLPHGAFCQVSGMGYALTAREDGPKVHDLTVGAEPLLPQKRYTVTTHSFAVDGPGLCNARFLRLAGDLEEAVLAWLQSQSPIHPQVEGRIRIVDESSSRGVE